MANTTSRVDELLEGIKRNRRELLTPEGVPLDLAVAGHGERMIAFCIDFGIMLGVVIALSMLAEFLFFRGAGADVVRTLILFVAFLARSCYFTHFELAWQGRTPGKKACGLRVINRDGGELTPGAVIARNLTREVEFFLPLSLFFSLDADAGTWQQLSFLGWALLVPSLPLWSRDHLRAGDIIAGTQVISIPKRVLLEDLTLPEVSARGARGESGYVFTHEQLAKYGAFELQVLEELLRRQDNSEGRRILNDVCMRIRNKIGWEEEVPPESVRGFLTAFYAAERADLERGKLFGRLREDKNTAANHK